MDEPVELTKSNVQMKRVVLFIFCIIMLYACASTRKTTQSSEVFDVSTEKTESESSNVERFIDTTKTDKKKITITEIEFCPPTVNNESPGIDDKPKASNVSGLSLPNIGNIDNATIKSIKQTTIESESETKGESNESSSTANIISEAVLENTEKKVMINEEPAPDPYKWRYIFYILLIGVAALLYFKRVPVMNWIKTILSGIRKIF